MAALRLLLAGPTRRVVTHEVDLRRRAVPTELQDLLREVVAATEALGRLRAIASVIATIKLAWGWGAGSGGCGGRT